MSNILFINVGKRVELVETFRVSLNKRGGGQIFGADIDPLAPGLRVVDVAFQMNKSKPLGWKNSLFEICRREKIALIIPSIDPDLLRLDSIRVELEQKFPQTQILLSSTDSLQICRNKRVTRDFFSSLGIQTPISLENQLNDLHFPIFVKPPDGSASKGAEKIVDYDTLMNHIKLRPDLMIEELIEGEEYTVDLYCDLSGTAQCAIPRKRIKVRDGEASQAIIEMDYNLIGIAKKIAEKLSLKGPVNIQFRKTKKGAFVAMEINPRFGGGVPLSISAGADFPGWIIDEYCLKIKPLFESQRIQDGLIMSRCDRSFFFKRNEILYQKVAEEVDI